MRKHLLFLAALVALASAANGSLNVQSDRAGLKVYLDNELIGTTPVKGHSIEPGEHWVSMFPSDSSEAGYDRLKSGSFGEKLKAVWYLSRVDKGTVRTVVGSGETKNVFLNLKHVDRAPGQAKWAAAGIMSIPFVVGAALGLVIGLVSAGN